MLSTTQGVYSHWKFIDSQHDITYTSYALKFYKSCYLEITQINLKNVDMELKSLNLTTEN